MKRSIREALQFVADYPEPVDDEVVTMHTGELVARTLYDIANNPSVEERGSLRRANRARKMIMLRLDGKRRPGTEPQRPQTESLLIKDMTGRELTND
jgi:hypothetical protein